jgi:hypothetical protein
VEKIPLRGSSLKFLADLYGVNPKYIQDATTIMEHDPDLFLRLKSGKVLMADARRDCGLTQRRVKKNPVGEDRSGGDGAKTMAAAGKSESATVIDGADPSATERSRLLALARAVEAACRRVPDSLKSQFEAVVSMAQRAIQDFH